MKNIKSLKINIKPCYLAGLLFVVSYAFFQFAYPYHLIRREQLSLFPYDWDYVCQTYVGNAWLVRFVTDFVHQFFHLPIVGPVVVSLALVAIASLTFSTCNRVLGKLPSYIIAVLVFVWSFMRETGNLYTTRYTFAVLGYLAIVYLSLRFRNHIVKALSFVILFVFGLWSLGSPYHSDYGKAWSQPKFDYERLVALDVETARENWDKVLKLSEKDLFMMEASYFYNLAHVMKGDIGEKLLEHSQGNAYDLLLRITSEQSVFTNSIAGEAWYHLGNMAFAEQSAITTLQASPNHTGARFIKRLACISLIKDEEIAAEKYLNLLSRTLFYSRWARSVMPGNQSESVRAWIEREGKKLDEVDFVHLGDVPRDVLKGLLKADPTNTIAQNYLLVYDLMRYDLEEFMEDYSLGTVNARLYQEAAMIWLSQKDMLDEEHASRYGINESFVSRMNAFGRNPDRYRNTYWYYYLRALNSNR